MAWWNSFDELSRWVLQTAINHIVASSVLVLLFTTLLVTLRSLSAATRSALWNVAFVFTIVMAFVSLRSLSTSPQPSAEAAVSIAAQVAPPALSHSFEPFRIRGG